MSRIIVITGATHGLGRAMAEGFIAGGHTVAGCGAVRSHVDWGDEADAPLAWEVLPQIDTKGTVLQWAALTGIDSMADRITGRSSISRTPRPWTNGRRRC